MSNAYLNIAKDYKNPDKVEKHEGCVKNWV